MKILHLCDKTAFSIWQSFVLLSGNLSKFQFNFIFLQNGFQTGQKHNINHAGKQRCPKWMRSLKPSPIKSPSPKIPIPSSRFLLPTRTCCLQNLVHCKCAQFPELTPAPPAKRLPLPPPLWNISGHPQSTHLQHSAFSPPPVLEHTATAHQCPLPSRAINQLSSAHRRKKWSVTENLSKSVTSVKLNIHRNSNCGEKSRYSLFTANLISCAFGFSEIFALSSTMFLLGICLIGLAFCPRSVVGEVQLDDIEENSLITKRNFNSIFLNYFSIFQLKMMRVVNRQACSSPYLILFAMVSIVHV